MKALAARLAGITGPKWIRGSRAELATYGSDGLPTHTSIPGLVVLPANRDELIQVVQCLHQAGTPFVARGAGTGLSGGALAASDAVIIALTRMNRVISLDPLRRRAVVEPGVVNARLSALARPHGLQYAPDPSSQTACTVGGNVAENAGGPHCLKYGVTTNHVCELEVLLPDGTLTMLGSNHGESWGPDLVGLFTGSEGMFGIATRITVRLVPLPPAVCTLLADFSSLRSASQSVSAIIAAGIVPAALEMMDQSCVRAVESSIYAAGYPADAAAVLLVELDGQPDSVEEETGSVVELLTEHGARAVLQARTEAERARLWQGRKKAFGAMGRIAPDLVVQDAVVPRSRLPEIMDTITGIGIRHGLTISNVFHAGDGNLHPNISFDRRIPDLAGRVRDASREIMEACLASGGSITGEHGIGADKLDYMPLMFDAASLEMMCRVRDVFDPERRANPGKVVPIHSCREWQASPAVRDGGALK